MTDVKSKADFAEIISGLAIIDGIGFGFWEYRSYKLKERREAATRLTTQ